MDMNRVKLNYSWTNGFNRNSLKTRQDERSTGTAVNQSTTSRIYQSTDLFHSRWFIGLVVSLAFTVFLNLFLTYWIITALKVGNGGLGNGNLVLSSKRITLKGPTRFTGWLTSEEISPFYQDQWVSISNSGPLLELIDRENQDNADGGHHLNNINFSMSNENLEFQGPRMIVYKQEKGQQEVQFSVDSDEITTSSIDMLTSSAWGGFNVVESLETSSIKGDFYQDLRLESRTKGVNIMAQGNLDLEARSGELGFSSFKDLTISTEKQLKMESSKLHLKSLPRRKSHRHDGASYRKEAIAYQICVCENGRLFLAPGNGVCSISSDSCSLDFTQSDEDSLSR